MFKTCWRFLKSRVFLEWYNPRRVTRLVEERGIHIAHVYLDFHEDVGRLADRSLFERDGPDFRMIDNANGVFRNLGKLQRSKQLWVTSMRELGDHLSALSELEVDYLPNGSALLKAGSKGMRSLSLTVPVTGSAIEVDGRAPAGTRWGREETTIWLDLDAGESRTISLGSNGTPRRLMPAGSTVPLQETR